jgi:hypothetical protein
VGVVVTGEEKREGARVAFSLAEREKEMRNERMRRLRDWSIDKL